MALRSHDASFNADTWNLPAVRLKPTLDVEVAKPLILSPRNVVVPNPVPEISRAEMEVVAKRSVEVPM